MPRVSAVITSGHASAVRSSTRRTPPSSVSCQLSTEGAPASIRSRLPSSWARRRRMSRECSRGGPGGLWAASCSSRSTRVAGEATGTSSALRVPTTTRERPRAEANHAARRSASGAPLSRRAASRRSAQRPALSVSGAITSAPPGASPSSATSRSSRAASVHSSVAEDGTEWAGSGAGATISAYPERGGGGSMARSVEPQEERLSSAIHRPSSSAAWERMEAGSTSDCSGLSASPSPRLSATTTPTRVRPPRGALTRCPPSRRGRPARDTRRGDPGGRRRRRRRRAAGRRRSTHAAGEALPLATGELEIVPGHALVLIARVAKQKGGMKGGDEHNVAIEIGAAAEPRDAVLGAEKSLGREVAESEDHRGLDGVELRHEEGIAGADLVRLGIPVPVRVALDHVADVAVALAVESHRGQHLGQELSRPPHEGLALLVLFLARPLADDDHLGLRVARAEHHGLPALAQFAERASLEGLFLRSEGEGRIRRFGPRQGHVGEAEITVMAEGVGDGGERLAESRARIVHRAQREGERRGSGVGRSASTRSRMACATSIFVMRGSSWAPPQRSSRMTWLSSASNPMSCRLTSLATRRSMDLARSLSAALVRRSLVSAAKPTRNAPPFFCAISLRMSGFGTRERVSPSFLPPDLILVALGLSTR